GAAVQDYFRASVGNALFNIALDNAFAEMDGARYMVFVPLIVFTHIDEMKFFAPVELRLNLVDRYLTDAALGIVDDVQKTLGMLHCHKRLLIGILELRT